MLLPVWFLPSFSFQNIHFFAKKGTPLLTRPHAFRYSNHMVEDSKTNNTVISFNSCCLYFEKVKTKLAAA
jgi:hypothetical protein